MAERRPRPASKGSLPADTPAPDLSVTASPFAAIRADLAVSFVFEGEKTPAIAGGGPSTTLRAALAAVMKADGFRGKRREAILWPSAGRFPAARHMVIGLGKKASGSADAVREACGLAARRALAVKARTLAVLLPEAAEGSSAGTLACAAAEGIVLGSYRMTKYVTGDEAAAPPPRTAQIVVSKAALSVAKTGAARGALRAGAANFVRDLVNEPAMSLTPSLMAEVARGVAKREGLEVKVFDKKALAAMRMGAILGVSAGSHQPPCVIHLIYRPPAGRKATRKVALVGKGLTFDSGGLSLKTASGMETMKLDKAGASAVLGVMRTLPRLAPDVEVHGILGMTENMPGGSAIKPGDILKTRGGKTIEVLNTDAEGRLVLADCLAYAQDQKVDEVIDLATLTGAVVVALGTAMTGVFGTDQPMVDRLLAASRTAGERMWQLPLHEEYRDQLRSEIADIKNTGGSRYGGAITAALFLKTFVKDDLPWIHLDIAGPAFLESENGYMRKGGTGTAVLTLLTYIESLAAAGGS